MLTAEINKKGQWDNVAWIKIKLIVHWASIKFEFVLISAIN